jgi:hypothetical protein
MMLLRKASAKGYLRAGKILQLMGKYEVALDTYIHGVKQVPTEDQEGRQVCGLQLAFRRLAQR